MHPNPNPNHVYFFRLFLSACLKRSYIFSRIKVWVLLLWSFGVGLAILTIGTLTNTTHKTPQQQHLYPNSNEFLQLRVRNADNKQKNLNVVWVRVRVRVCKYMIFWFHTKLLTSELGMDLICPFICQPLRMHYFILFKLITFSS